MLYSNLVIRSLFEEDCSSLTLLVRHSQRALHLQSWFSGGCLTVGLRRLPEPIVYDTVDLVFAHLWSPVYVELFFTLNRLVALSRAIVGAEGVRQHLPVDVGYILELRFSCAQDLALPGFQNGFSGFTAIVLNVLAFSEFDLALGLLDKLTIDVFYLQNIDYGGQLRNVALYFQDGGDLYAADFARLEDGPSFLLWVHYYLIHLPTIILDCLLLLQLFFYLVHLHLSCEVGPLGILLFVSLLSLYRIY